MRKFLCVLILFVFVIQVAMPAQAIEYNKKQIKHGMYEKIVNEQYGQPELSKDLDPGFLPIPRKRSLYKLDDEDYMILQFYSARVNSITILSDVDREEAVEVFNQGLKGYK